FSTRGFYFGADSHLGLLDGIIGAHTRLLESGAAFVQCRAAQSFLMAEDFTTSFAQGFLVSTHLLLRILTQLFGFESSALDSLAPLLDDMLEGTEKGPAEEQIEEKYYDRGGYRGQKQIAKLFQNFHESLSCLPTLARNTYRTRRKLEL